GVAQARRRGGSRGAADRRSAQHGGGRGIARAPLIPAHSASLRAFTPVFDGLWTRVNALMLGIQAPRFVAVGPRNGVPATHSASQTRVNALLLSRGAPRGDERTLDSARAACRFSASAR